ncbi:MAG TPA: YceI family protein [Pyrinomonadaceae bacterium]|nr:YceI family protein [Pyrinomonadaceae bacterium]
MRKYFAVAMLIIAGVLSQSCASNPADNKPKASVAEAVPQAGSTPLAGAETLTITPANSKVDFVASKVTRSHNGSFKQFSGTIDLVNNSAEQSRVAIDMDTNSVTTDDDGLTKHLKTPDFFDVIKYPKATFTSTKIQPHTAVGATHLITGNFDLHGVMSSITFPATIQIAPDKVAVNAEFSINRKDWGIIYAGKADDLIRDAVVIKLSLNVPRKQ